MAWKKLLAYIAGSVDQELLLRNEYLVMKNHMLRQPIPGRVRFASQARRVDAPIQAYGVMTTGYHDGYWPHSRYP
jgi:hypothetical protein